MLPRLEDKQPCYLLYRLDTRREGGKDTRSEGGKDTRREGGKDTRSEGGKDWIFISYSPDFSPVRHLAPVCLSVCLSVCPFVV